MIYQSFLPYNSINKKMMRPIIMKAPEDISIAIAKTIKWALIYCCNYTLENNPNIKEINELMEAIHDIPDHPYRWAEGSMNIVKNHFACFDNTKWPNSPNLVKYFENQLSNNV